MPSRLSPAMRWTPCPPSAAGAPHRPADSSAFRPRPSQHSCLGRQSTLAVLLYTSRHCSAGLARPSFLVNAPSSTPTSTVRKASLFYFVFVMFSYTTGGPFGLEAMVTTSGPGMSLLYLLILPLFLSIPVSLVAAELT